MKKQVLAGVAILIGASALCGQTKAEYGAAFQFAGAAGADGKLFGSESLGSQIVTGKPFSATEERHSMQVLGDGTHIETGETNRLYRDDQGRTRIEPANGNITIFDPVAGFRAELNPATKTVSRTNITVREGRVTQIEGRVVARTPATYTTAENSAEDIRSKLAKSQEELAQMLTRYTEKSPQVVQLRAQIADLEKASAIDQVKALTSKYQAEYSARSPSPGGEQTMSFTTENGLVVTRVGPGDNASVESLPAQMVNGALAQGTRTTETIPIGKIGNDRAINIVNERWFSSDLQMLVKSTSSDPRFGDTTYQLTNIVQASPDPSLFQIPADYTIRK